MENNSHCMSLTGAEATDTVPEGDTVTSFAALNWPIVNGEGKGVALPQGHNFYSALYARTLFC
jgi:hypothetical protein